MKVPLSPSPGRCLALRQRAGLEGRDDDDCLERLDLSARSLASHSDRDRLDRHVVLLYLAG
ncbi:MAG: hypothetical protein CM1200mP41_24700 [Gammaproteobacteria bacterium]|nr:MAG: hypothetical protein CM1200mP41_24700 [Gammaproteobacteria bacterium]